MKGLYTLEMIQEKKHLTRASALNFISKLKKKRLVQTKGGGKQIRWYKISDKPIEKENGMYEIINKYTPVKLYSSIRHICYGKKYTIEETIVDCLKKQDPRHELAAAFLLNKIKDWKRMKDLIKKEKLENRFIALYNLSRQHIKIRRIPKNFENYLNKFRGGKVFINEYDIISKKNDIA